MAASDGKTLDGKLYPHPPLIFAVRDRHLFVWALSGNARPTPKTQRFKHRTGTQAQMELSAMAPWQLLARSNWSGWRTGPKPISVAALRIRTSGVPFAVTLRDSSVCGEILPDGSISLSNS
jgi:hypothetical protein